jgi:hypothetical protein
MHQYQAELLARKRHVNVEVTQVLMRKITYSDDALGAMAGKRAACLTTSTSTSTVEAAWIVNGGTTILSITRAAAAAAAAVRGIPFRSSTTSTA